MRSTKELIEALADSVVEAGGIRKQYGDAAAEVVLRRVQLEWNRARPLPLHPLN